MLGKRALHELIICTLLVTACTARNQELFSFSGCDGFVQKMQMLSHAGRACRHRGASSTYAGTLERVDEAHCGSQGRPRDWHACGPCEHVHQYNAGCSNEDDDAAPLVSAYDLDEEPLWQSDFVSEVESHHGGAYGADTPQQALLELADGPAADPWQAISAEAPKPAGLSATVPEAPVPASALQASEPLAATTEVALGNESAIAPASASWTLPKSLDFPSPPLNLTGLSQPCGQQVFSWVFSNWTQCSHSCGGVQRRFVTCVRCAAPTSL